MTLQEAMENVGRQVVYDPGTGQAKERGEISSVSPTLVFVRYGHELHAKATVASYLELVP